MKKVIKFVKSFSNREIVAVLCAVLVISIMFIGEVQ